MGELGYPPHPCLALQNPMGKRDMVGTLAQFGQFAMGSTQLAHSSNKPTAVQSV